jgi:hypothetical protein
MILIHPIQNPDFFQGSFIDLDQLESYRDQLIVINAASEHWGKDQAFITQMHDALESADFNFWILSHHPGDHLIKKRIIFYPWWYYHSKKTFETIDIVKHRSRKLGCLHGNPRPHRIANYLSLKSQFDLHSLEMSIFSSTTGTTRPDDVELLEREIVEWASIEPNLNDRYNRVSDLTIKIPALDDAYIHITSETTVIDRIFLSEKTWKPIAAGQLFLHFGNPGTIGFLRTVGVDTFDDIIDHDSYDTVSDWRQRMGIIHKLASDLMALDLQDIWHTTLSRRQSNVDRFFAGDFMQSFRHNVLDNLLGNLGIHRYHGFDLDNKVCNVSRS